jgi:hypothetical protein
MPDLDEEKLTQVANESLDIIHKFYKVKGDIPDDALIRVKLATTMFGGYVKYKQHQSNMGAVKMAVATQILEDPEDRKLYLRMSAPELKLDELKKAKLIEAGVDPEKLKPVKEITAKDGYVESIT